MLKVSRNLFSAVSTEGKLFIDGVFECFTLEPRSSVALGKPYCTPAGVYPYRVQRSQHFERDVICIQDVPGFTAVEIHPGNFPKDTHGCTLVGETQGPDFVGHSEAAFNALLEKISSIGLIQYANEP